MKRSLHTKPSSRLGSGASRVGVVALTVIATAVLVAPRRAETECSGQQFRTGNGCVTVMNVGCYSKIYYCDGTFAGDGGDPTKCQGMLCFDGCNGWCPQETRPDEMHCSPQACGGGGLPDAANGCLGDGCPLAPDPSQPQCTCLGAACDFGDQPGQCSAQSKARGTCDVPQATCSGPPTQATCGDRPVIPIYTEEICDDGLDNNCDGAIDEDCAPPDKRKQPEAGQSDGNTCDNVMDPGNGAGDDPIHLGTRAAVTEPFTDFTVDTLVTMSVTRTYSSADASVRGTARGNSFGRGWHHDWETTLACTDTDHCRVTQGISGAMNFKRGENLAHVPGSFNSETWQIYSRSDGDALMTGERDVLARSPTGDYILYRADGREFDFKSECALDNCSTSDNYCTDPAFGGRAHLSKVIDQRGNAVTVSYDRPSGVLLSLTDELGHSLKLLASGNACSSGLAQKLVFDAVTYLTYEYDTTNRELKTVRQWTPDGHGPVVRSYQYGSSGPGYLVKMLNESGDPIVEFGYDSHKYANSIVDRKSSVTVSYADGDSPGQTKLYMTSLASASSKTSSQTRGRSGATTISDGSYTRALAWQAHGLRCSEDFDKRVHWFDRDAIGRVVRHAVYAPGDYTCASSEPPSATVLPLLEEWFDYGLRREIVSDVFVDLKTVTSTTRRSALGDVATSSSGQTTYLTVSSLDYDQTTKPGDPSGYRCSASGDPMRGLLPCREIVSGYTLDEEGHVVPEQHMTYYSYDGRGRIVRTIGPVVSQGSPPAGTVDPVEERSYWPDTGSADDLPRLGRLREVRRYPGGSGAALVTSYDYDVFGPYQVTDPSGRVTLLVKDARGRVVAVATPDGRGISTRYYDGNSPRTVTLSSGATRRFSYDLRGRLSLIEAFPSDPETVYPSTLDGATGLTAAWSETREYDPAGNAILVERRDSGGVVRFRQLREYDADHRLRKQAHPEATVAFAQWDYDGAGLLLNFTDEEGRAVEFVPDGLGNPVTVRRKGVTISGAPVSLDVGSYSYEPERSSLRSVTDGAGRTTFYQHDDFDRLLSVDNPSVLRSGLVRYRYDARGNVVARTWGSTTTTYGYDGLDRLTSLTAVSTVGAPSVSYVFRYDENAADLGRLSSIVEASRTTAFAYDEVGRIRFETVTESAVSAPLVTEYRYGPDGAADTLVHPSGLSVKYDRDPASGRITAVRNLAANTALATDITYWPSGPLKALLFANGTSLSQTFNLRYEPLSIASGPISLGYTPTLAGDVASISSPQGNEEFTYDFADRLTKRKSTAGVRSEPLDLVYNGGRLAQAFPSGAATARYAFGYDDQTNVSAVSRYDDVGASIASTICLVHDALGRLVLAGLAAPSTGGPDAVACRNEADVQSVIARFRYDAFNRRIARQDASGNWTYFAFDSSGQPLSELIPSGNAWAPVRDYVFLEARPLAQIEFSGASVAEAHPYFFHVDHLGMPRALASANGQVVWKATVLPNGEAAEEVDTDIVSGQKVVTNLRLPGQYDERLFAAAGITGLQGPYYNWNRWYLPSMGRYMELDPLALAGGFNTEYGVDWYGYVRENPLKWVDPSGLCPDACVVEGAAVAMGIDALANAFSLWALMCALDSRLCGSLRPTPGPLPLAVCHSGPTLLPSHLPPDVQRQSEYEQAKRFCDTPSVPGANPCATLSRQIDHANRCIDLYQSWDARWLPGRHDQKIEDWLNRLQNLKDEHNRNCTQPWPY